MYKILSKIGLSVLFYSNSVFGTNLNCIENEKLVLTCSKTAKNNTQVQETELIFCARKDADEKAILSLVTSQKLHAELDQNKIDFRYNDLARNGFMSKSFDTLDKSSITVTITPELEADWKISLTRESANGDFTDLGQLKYTCEQNEP